VFDRAKQPAELSSTEGRLIIKPTIQDAWPGDQQRSR